MIYCVEDDEGVRNMVVYTLNASGLDARGFSCGEEFFGVLKEKKPSLVLLDIMLPGEDGLEILKKLRRDPATADIPVIMETARGTEYDRIVGLDAGADGYLAKPFGMLEMVSRVRAILRRTSGKRNGSLCLGGLRLDQQEHTVYAGEREVLLSLKEYELLKLFMSCPGRLFTRSQLLGLVWESGVSENTRTVDVHVGTLRTKLGEFGAYIETVRGAGYRMKKP